MGFFLTIIYILLAYLSPVFWFPALAHYHIELWLGLLAIITSIPSIPGSRIGRYPQGFLIVGLLASAFLSMIANHWMGGGVLAIEAFLPHLAVFYLVAMNCRTARRLKALITVLAIVAVVVIAGGIHALITGQSGAFVILQTNEAGDQL